MIFLLYKFENKKNLNLNNHKKSFLYFKNKIKLINFLIHNKQKIQKHYNLLKFQLKLS